jgi:hypothetical protein
MIAETLSLDFVGNAAGLQDAVMASQRALQALNRDTSRFSFSIGRVMRTIVTPIASIILSAFAAKKALADFTQSGLPGVSRFNQTLGLMRISMFRLSSAVGELLAPAAERAARIVTWIAERLEPIIRTISANIPAMATLLKQLGSNLLAVLRPLMPTVFGIIDGILARFQNADWGQVLAELWRIWQQTWAGILNFVGPILVRVATLIDTAVRVGRDGLVQLFTWLTQKAAEFGITLPNTIKGLNTFTESLQAAILVGISALEVAIDNIPLLWSAMQASASVAIKWMSDNWRALADFMVESFTTSMSNLGTMLMNLGQQLIPVFSALGTNLAEIMSKSLSVGFDNAFNYARKKAILFWMEDDLAKMPAPAAAAARAGIDLMYPSNTVPTFDFMSIPGLDGGKLLDGLIDMPALKLVKADMKELNAILDQINKTFGAGVAKRIQDAFLQGPKFIAQIMGGLIPGLFGKAPAPRIDRFEAIGPLLFGTAAANAKETNVGNKNPLVPLAQQQVALTREQLVQQRAAAKAAERKARMANF